MTKLQRYQARTLGGGTDYSLEKDEYGPLCRDDDVEALEKERDRLAKLIDEIAQESALSYDEERVWWVEVQMTRSTWKAVAKWREQALDQQEEE